MAELKIIYKTEEMFHCEETEISMSFVKPIAELWVGTKENKKLETLVEQIESDLRKRTWLGEEEQLEISQFDKYVIEYETLIGKRIDSYVYNFCKNGHKLVEEGKTTWEHLIKEINERGCSECI